MSKNIRTQLGKIVGKTLNDYHQRVKPKIDELKFKEQYQGRIIDCMVGEVDDNYIETPETDSAIVKLEHSKEGLVKVPSIKGKTILVDSDGNETDTPAEGCRLVSVGEEEDNKLIILSKNSDSSLHHKTEILLDEPLRSIPNGAKDEIIENQVIRRVGSILFDGSEDEEWVDKSVDEQVSDGYYRLGFKLPYKSLEQGYVRGYCNRLRIRLSEPHGSYEYLYIQKTSANTIQFYIQSTRFTRDTFRQWLSENPVEVLYELEEPIIEELPNGITIQGFDDTTMYIENSITPTVQYGYNALIPYKEELRTQKEEIETNILDIENNIIPYLMDMEYNLMLMEDDN